MTFGAMAESDAKSLKSLKSLKNPGVRENCAWCASEYTVQALVSFRDCEESRCRPRTFGTVDEMLPSSA